MSALQTIPIEDIRRRADVRPLDDDAIAALSDSIEAVGLISPIRVRLVADKYEVIAGSHRLAACDLIGHREIACLVVEDDDLHAELAMIDENLCRAELSVSDRVRQTARRKAIYEELHPVIAHGGDRKSDQVAKSATRSFADETAAKTGSAARTVRLDAERGAKVIDEVLDMVRGTKLDTGTYLDKIMNLSPNDQVAAVKRDLAADRQRQSNAAPSKPAPKPKPIPGEVYRRFLALAGEMAELKPGHIARGLPAANKRADLVNHVRGLLAQLEELDGILEGASS